MKFGIYLNFVFCNFKNSKVMLMKANDKIVKKGQRIRKQRHATPNGVCFEPLEPRLLLSGSWGAGVDAPSHDSQTSTHGGFTQQTVTLSENPDASITGTQNLNPRQTAVHVDLLAQAPVLNAVNAVDPVLEAPLPSEQAALATGNSSANGTGSESDTQLDRVAAAGTRELVFINENIAEYQQLITDLQGENANRVIEVVVLDADRDGIEQVSEILADRADLAAIHFITHGSEGQINLGSSWLNSATLQQNIASISSWGNALKAEGDILFYGCNLAADNAGQSLLTNIALTTGADVAASDDLTGNSKLGGDWDLEYNKGTIDTQVAISTDPQHNWSGTLATFTVNTTADTVDATPGDGLAEDVAGNTSLRAAIMEANALGGADTIVLLDGTFSLDLTGGGPDYEHGDLDVTDTVSVVGAGATSTIIDGNLTDRIFEFTSGSEGSSISGVTLQNGDPGTSDGGAILTQVILTVTDAELTGNAAKNGGAIMANNTLTLERATVVGNSAQNGGGVSLNSGSDHSLTNVTFSGNSTTSGSGGGLDVKGSVSLTNVTIANNSANANGGGVNKDASLVTITNSLIADNSAGGSGNDAYGTFASDGSNLVEDVVGANGFVSDIIGIDPNLQTLANDGGEIRVLALGVGSDAINNGNSASAAIVDARGFLRGDGSPDIGAYEASANAATTADYLDRFDTDGSFSGDDGALSWSNDWQEIGEANGSASGDVQVSDEFFGDGGGNTELWTKLNKGVWREANLSGAASATLSFNYARAGLEADDHLVVYVQTAGMTGGIVIPGAPDTWDEIGRYSGSADDGAYLNDSIDISAYIAADTRIMFLAEGAIEGNDKIFVDNVRIDLTASATPETADLWLSTEDVVVGGGQTGDDSWNPSDLIGIGDPNLNLGPGTTSGTFATVFDADGFSIGWDLNAAHYVTAPIQIGSSNFQLQAGDLMLSPTDNGTIFTSNNAVALDTDFQASVTADNADLVVFRPDTVGDYTQGQYGMLLEDVADGHWLQGITLIEQDITVGGYALQAGDFLYSCSNPSINNHIWLYETGTTGVGATPVSRQVFLDGDDAGVGIGGAIHGIELLENTTEVGGQVLDAGTLLVNVDAADTVGSNGLNVDRFDVFALKVSTSSLVGAGEATAQMLFDGSHVAFDSSQEDLDALTLFLPPSSPNMSPTADPGGPYDIAEGDDLVLDAGGSSDADGTIVEYKWDLDNDLTYGDVTTVSATPTIDWATIASWGLNDGDVAGKDYTIGLQVVDNLGATHESTAVVTVHNVAPTLSVAGAGVAGAGVPYALNLSATDPGDDTITSWTINWGDGTIETIPGNPSIATHIYSNTGFTHNILVSVTDEDNTANYIHNDLFAGHYIDDAGVYRIQGDWGDPPVEFANEGTLDKTIQPIIGPDGNLYVSGESSRNVLRYNTNTGAFIDVFANIPGEAGGIAFGPDGNLYVADYTNGEILRFNGSDGSAMGAFATGIGGMPYSLTFGPDGNLYVALYDNAEVLKYEGLSGTALGTFISAGAGGLGTPEQIVFGPDGNLYIADVANNSVLRFNGADGTPMGDFVADIEPHLDEPNGLAFGPDGNLYVSDSKDGVILRFDGSTGVFIDEYAAGLDKPSLLVFAPDLQVHVTANAPPTFSSFSGPATSGDEDSEITVTFGNLTFQGDEADADGTVDAFIVKSVTSGTLKIGASAGTATAFAVGSNDTINAANSAYWTPAPGANGTLNAFAVVAEDDAGAESITPVTATVAVAAYPVVNDQGLSVDENALSGTSVGTIAATAGNPAQNYSKLYWVDVDTDELRRIELDGTMNQTLADQSDGTAVTGPRSVTVDDVNGHVYWTNNNSGEIWRANLDGSSAAPVLIGLASPMGIAVDPSGEKIYWFDAAANELWRADFDGSNAAALITTDISAPKALAIDTTGGKIYWTNNGSSPGLGEIKRADLDGSNIETVTSGLDDPHSIALDTVRGKVYWAEPGLQEIHRADMAAGVGSETVVVGLGEPRAVAVDTLRGELYWADAGTDRIERANLYGSSVALVAGTGQWPTSIALGPPTQNLTYSITAGNTNGAFNLDPVTGELTVANSSELDFETTPAFNLTVTVTDAGGRSDNATITVDLNNINEAPVAVDDTASTNEDTPVTVNVVSNDTDVENDTLTVSTVTQGTNGAVTFAGGSVTYTPNANFSGSDSFTYTVSDGNGGTDTATVDVTVSPVNDAPVAVDDNASTNEDTPVTVNVVSNDTDVEGDPLTVSAVTQGTNGAVTFAGGSVTYTPNANFSGSDSFTYTVSDGNGGTDTATVDVTVTPVNDAPVAVDDTTSTNEDTPVTVDVVSNDTDVEGDPLTVSAVTQGTNGTVTFAGGTVTYTPNANFSGPDTFTYTVSDGNGGTDTATVDVTVSPVNDAPVAVDDTASTNEDTPVTVNVVSNDTDIEGDPLTVSAVTQGTNGTVTFAGGTVTYTPNANFSGPDSFTYTVSDGNGGTDTATVDVTVNPVNDAPVAVDDSASTNEDTPVTVNVVSNDTDVEGDSLTVSAVTQGTNGTVTFAGGTVTYTPNSNFSGPDTFTYTVSDGNGGTDTATVDVTVSPVNDPGTVTIDNLTPAQGDTLTANVTDVDGAAGAITYQWFRDGVAIGGVSGKTYTIVQADVGAVITVTADYIDDLSSVESLTSGPTAPVTNVNDPGVVAINNLTPVQGDMLTASVSDADGAGGTISYQWYRDGVAITGATGVSYLTVPADEGAVITVTADYIDDQGSVENLTSAGTAAVAHVNVAPTASNLNAAETYTEDIPLDLADIVIADIDSANVNVTLALTDPAAGSLSTGTSGAVTANFSGGVWTASGPTADVNALLAGVVFTPSTNYDGSFAIAVSVDDGAAAPMAGVKIITATPVGDTPRVSDISTPATVQSGQIVIDRNADDGAEVTHFRIANITNGTLYLADGITPIRNGDTITVAQGQAGVRFTPAADTLGQGSFTVEASEDGVSVAQQSGAAISVITVIPPSTSPTVTIPSSSGDTAGPEPDTAPEASEPAAEPEATPEEDVLEAVAPPVNRGPAEESVPQHRGLTSGPMPVLAQAVRYVSLMRATGVDLRDIAERLSDNMGPSQKAAAADSGPQRADIQAGVHNLMSARAYLNMVNSLDAVKKEMADDNQLNRVYLGSAIVSSVGLSVGYVVWLIRGGLLLSSLLSSLPAWQILDPLPILARKKDDDRSEDDESLESILERKPPKPKPKKEPADASPDAEEKKR